MTTTLRHRFNRAVNNTLPAIHRVVGEMPWLYCPTYRVIGRHPRFLIGRRTEVVIEGYPRCGNTFAVVAFDEAQDGRLEIAHHLHSVSQVLRGVALGKPVCAVIREPEAAIKSFLIWHHTERGGVWRETEKAKREAIRNYLSFYRKVETVADGVVVADFSEITTDMGRVIDRINARFGTSFGRFQHTPENVEAVFRRIDEVNASNMSGSPLTVSRPTSEKQMAKDEIDLSGDAALLSECKRLHASLTRSLNGGQSC